MTPNCPSILDDGALSQLEGCHTTWIGASVSGAVNGQTTCNDIINVTVVQVDLDVDSDHDDDIENADDLIEEDFPGKWGWVMGRI